MKRAHVYAKGKVQGVFFREFVKRNGQRLGLTGWVSNLADGRLEAVIEGRKELVSKLIELIKEGPPLAELEHVDVIWEEATKEFSEFSIRRLDNHLF